MKKYHCIDCEEKISRQSGVYGNSRCHPCANKIAGFKHGLTLKQHYCKICKKRITYQSVLYGQGRCRICSSKIRNLKLSIKYKKEGNPFFGKHHTKKSRKKISLAGGGTGIPYENTEYGAEFDNNLKEQVRFRSHYKCQVCGCPQIENGRQLDCHHIDYNKKNNILNNLIALCKNCHRATNDNRDYWQKYFTEKINGNI